MAVNAPVSPASSPAISELAPSFARALRAQNKSPRTVVGYLEGVQVLGG